MNNPVQVKRSSGIVQTPCSSVVTRKQSAESRKYNSVGQNPVLFVCITILMLVTFAIACNKDKEVEIKVYNSAITYNSAKGEYWGNYYNSGTANFKLWLYLDSNEDDIGILIDGYATLPSNPANFKLDVGTYSVAETEAIKTIFPADENLDGTYFFNKTIGQNILITEGSFTLATTPEGYDIETNFKGKDVNSGATIEDIRIKFVGRIIFKDESQKPLAFSDIKQSIYTATGTPYPNIPSAPSSWNGEVYPKEDETGQYYAITNWANWAEPLWLDYKDGKLILDNNSKVGEDGDYDLYFFASYISEGFNKIEHYEVKYDKNTRTLNFSNTYNGHQVYVGQWGKNRYNGNWTFFNDTQVRDTKLVLTPSVYLVSPKIARDLIPEIKIITKTKDSVNRSTIRNQSTKMQAEQQNRTTKTIR